MSTHSHSSSCFRPSSAHRHHHSPPPPPISGYPNLTTCLYHTPFALFSLTWSHSFLSRSLLLHFHQNPKPFNPPPPSPSPSSFRLHMKPLVFWKKKGSKKLSPTIHVFWDLTRSKFSSAPEPLSGFYFAVVVDHQMTLLVGDLIKEAFAKTKAMKLESTQWLVLKREHVIAHKIYTTRARIGGEVRKIRIECGLFNEELSLGFSVDEKRVLEIKRLKWKFRGNERIEVEGIPVHIYWDVYNWVFEVEKANAGNGNGNAVFMFRFEEEERGLLMGRQQNWNMGMSEFEWKKMRNSLSSSSVSMSMSMSSAGSSSAGGSSSVMEWANMEESDQNEGQFGFSLLLYAWRK